MVYLVQVVQLPLTRQYLFSLALPIALLVVAVWFHRTLGELVVTTPGVASLMMVFNWLLPGFAFWFLLKRICDLRVSLWLFAVSVAFCLPVVLLFTLLVIFFGLHKWLRIAGLALFAPMAFFGMYIFATCLPGNFSNIAEGKAVELEKPLELKKIGEKDVYIYPENYSALDPYIYKVRVERKLNSFLALRETVYSKQFGCINNLKVLDAHTIQFDVTTNSDYSKEPVGPITKQIKID